MPGAGATGKPRARGEVLAERVNAAADLLDRGVPTASAARELAERFGCSARQAHRYLQHAGRAGRLAVPAPGALRRAGGPGGMAVPAPAAVSTVRRPVPLIARVRARAAATGQTLSAVV